MTAIRPARMGDANGIACVQVESWRSTYVGIVPDGYLASLNTDARTGSWKEQISAGTSTILVAEDEIGIFGFASGGRLRDRIDGYDAELYAIYLLQHKQKQGVGKVLAQQVAKGLNDIGFRSLIVWVLAKNPAAEFYQHLGGAAVATKQIEIGGAQLTEIAFGWASISGFLRSL